MPVPVLSEVDCESTPRFVAILKAFQDTFGQAPELFARAPGRVNIIGEHIDYCDYGVLPMAIALDTVVAIARGGTKLTIANVDSAKFPTIEFDTDPAQAVDQANHSWGNYIVAAYKGVFEALSERGLPAPTPVGLQLMVHGRVPAGAGLSSSAALVCATMLAILGALGLSDTFKRDEVAQMAVRTEGYVGVQAGGMDQAISMMAIAGFALHVEFGPVRGTTVALPEGVTFVIANSLAVSNKAEGAHTRYNMRVVECRLATALLALALGAPRAEAVATKTLKMVEARVADKYGDAKEACRAVLEHLHTERYTQEEVEGLLGVSLPVFFAGGTAVPQVLGAAAAAGGFKLQQRALHVYGEAARVLQFKALCASTLSSEAAAAALGTLMTESHRSCADLYECSCPELEQITTLACSAGALGSRLTGAGWGGCSVSLVPDALVDSFIATLRDQYYGPKITAGVITQAQLGDCLFATKPAAGAAVLRNLKLGDGL